MLFRWPSLQALRAETMVDGLPHAFRWWPSLQALLSETIFNGLPRAFRFEIAASYII